MTLIYIKPACLRWSVAVLLINFGGDWVVVKCVIDEANAGKIEFENRQFVGY